MYMLMARAHRYAIDYIEQAPVIVLAAARGNAHVSRSERAFIQEQLADCQSKALARRDAFVRPAPAAAVTRRQGINLKPGDGHQAARAASGGPADRGAWPPVRWPGMVETGDGLKPLYGRLMALAMWPG